MSMAPIRSHFSRKTLAIALAAGVSFSGVQVVSAQTGHDLTGQAVAAEAGKLDQSVIKSHSVIANKSKAAITTEKDTFSDVKGKDKFLETHGDKVNFDVNMEIPDTAKTGESITFKINGAFEPDMVNGNGKKINAIGNSGENFVIGEWKYNASDKTVTYTLSRDASEYQDRKVHIQLPMRITPLVIDTGDKSLKDKTKPQTGSVTVASTGTVLDEFKYEAPYIYKGSEGTVHIWDQDYPMEEENGYYMDELTPNINTGEFNGRLIDSQIGSANVTNLSNYEKGEGYKIVWGGYPKEPWDPKGARDVSIEYTLDNPNFKLTEDTFMTWYYPGKEGFVVRNENGVKNGYTYDPDKTKSYTYDDVKNGTFEKETGVKYSIDISKDGQKAVVHYDNVKNIDALITFWNLRVKGNFTPGDKFTLNAKFVNGVGNPHEAFNVSYYDNQSFTYTMPDSIDDGSGKKINITKSAEMKALVNGKDANDKNSAEKITGGKGNFSIELKNTGTIGASKATVKFPKDVTDKDGKTERVIDLSDGSFAPGKTKKINLGELNVPNGAQENKFTVEMNGFKSMSDPAWTNTAKTSDSVDPTWDNAEVPDGGTKKIPAGGGAKDAPKGTKYELTGDHPDWITIDGKTGEITAKPPRGTQPGENQVTVTTTFPDGSTDTDKPTITVTHSDVFIEKVKEVKPDGTVILHRNDGQDITFKVPTGSKVEVNKDGDLVITNPGEKPKTVKLKHTTVTESGKPGEDGYKITLTTPDGKKVTFDGYDNYVESVTKQPNGDYLVKRNDGTEWTIKLSDIRNDIKNLKGKDAEQDKRLNDLEGRVDSIDKEIADLGDRITKNKGAIEDHRKSINDLNQEVGSINNELGDIKNELNRLDGQDIKEVRDNGDGTYTLIRNNGDEVTGIIDTSGDIKSITDNGDGTITLTKNDGSTEVVDLTHTTVETSGKPGDKDYTVTITTPDGNKVTLNGSNTYPSKVTDNGDGTYTIVLNDGTKVPGKIGDGQDIKELIPNDDGTMTVIHKDGSKSKVDLKQVTITEANEGTPEHTVTITSPNGDTVTFNVFDNYVTNVKKLDNGDYEVTRNDGTTWIIQLSDIRDRITALEKKDSPTRAEFDAVKKDLADLNDKVDAEFKNIDNRFVEVEGDIANLQTDLTDLEARITKVESRLTVVENRTDNITKCVAGAGTAAIPAMLSIPLMMMTQLNIPGIKDFNTEIQKQIGIYNPDLARAWEQNGGILQAGAALAGLAGMIGGLAYIADQCDPMMQTDAAKETDLGKLSSKLDEGSSAKKKAEQNTEAKSENKENSSSSSKEDAEAPAAETAE